MPSVMTEALTINTHWQNVRIMRFFFYDGNSPVLAWPHAAGVLGVKVNL